MDTLSNEQLLAKYNAGKCTRDEQIDAMVRLFGMDEDRAVFIVDKDYKLEVLPPQK